MDYMKQIYAEEDPEFTFVVAVTAPWLIA